jgi:hypothetical protein
MLRKALCGLVGALSLVPYARADIIGSAQILEQVYAFDGPHTDQTQLLSLGVVGSYTNTLTASVSTTRDVLGEPVAVFCFFSSDYSAPPLERKKRNRERISDRNCC